MIYTEPLEKSNFNDDENYDNNDSINKNLVNKDWVSYCASYPGFL